MQTLEKVQVDYKIPKNLLSVGTSNAKTKKNGRDTRILYLAPATQNSRGADMCPNRSAGCTASCLFTAGRGRMSNVANARINRTEYFLDDPKTFIAQMTLELEWANLQAKRTNSKIAIRLNGTSDRDFLYLIKKFTGKDFRDWENLKFYDYTKVPSKLRRYDKSNYVQTFSRAEDNHDEAMKALADGYPVSVVFRKELPETWNGYPVVNGDSSDDLMLDRPYSEGYVLGLVAKGDGKKDTTGFVVD